MAERRELKPGEKDLRKLDGVEPFQFGKLSFAYVITEYRKKGMNILEKHLYRCPLCNPEAARLFTPDKVQAHLEKHDKARDRALIVSELGSGLFKKPAPGQLGILELGVADVSPKVAKAKKVKK